MNDRQRQRFDQVLEEVLAELPDEALALLDEIPLVVEDHPSQKTIDDMGLESRDELCGLYTGIPLIERTVLPSADLSDPEALSACVTIFREGILGSAQDESGRISRRELKRQIRITILHELGHHHGLDEHDLDELGYG